MDIGIVIYESGQYIREIYWLKKLRCMVVMLNDFEGMPSPPS